jgi:diadenylate cyclase
VSDLTDQLSFLFNRFDWLSFLDLALVTLVFFIVMVIVKDTQAMVLLRGVAFLIIILIILTSIFELPAFSWLLRNIFPTLVIAIPVIFAPEIRRGLEKIGRAGSSPLLLGSKFLQTRSTQQTIRAVVNAAARLSAREHGALIVLQRSDHLSEYLQTGTRLNAGVTAELLMQIFYPNTPLHDGAVIISENRIEAAACVMPLSASGILNRTPEQKMGLRHRAALGISESTDAVAVIVSEETGAISIAHSGRLIRRLDSERLENILMAFFSQNETTGNIFSRMLNRIRPTRKQE